MQPINALLSVMIILSFLAAVVLHECSHVLMATWLGDNAPSAEGRLTLRLRPHIDAMGMLLCVIMAFQPISLLEVAPHVILAIAPVGLGWGKPIKTDPWKLRIGANTGVLLVACAGLLGNLLVGLILSLIISVLHPYVSNNPFTEHLLQFLIVFAVINTTMAIFNLLPIYPLDGYQILYTLLPSRQAVRFSRSATYGPFILLFGFFMLPFLGALANASSLPIFHPAAYFWLGGTYLVSFFSGLPFNLINLYYSI